MSTQTVYDFHEQIGDEHILTSIETPMRDDAFALSDAEKKRRQE